MLADFAALKGAGVRIDHHHPDMVYKGRATALRKHLEFKGIAVVRRASEVSLRPAK
jgi:hypothetical protein